MPPKRCCCVSSPSSPCEPTCVVHGQHYCTNAETTNYYYVQILEPSVFHGTGAPDFDNDYLDLCCRDMWLFSLDSPPSVYMFPLSTYSCTWEDEVDDACGRLYLDIASSTSAQVRLELAGGKTIVWKSQVATYDPLCTSPFYYSAADSDPPTDCAWPDVLCVIPTASCCPDKLYPKTLNVTIVDNGACGCANTAVSNTVTLVEYALRPDLVHAPALINGQTVSPPEKLAARWIGTLTVGDCGLEGDIELWCFFGTPEEGGIHMQLGWVDFGGSPCLAGAVVGADDIVDPSTTCDPFIVTFSGITDLAGCCPDGGANLTIIFTE